ncbi:Plant cysteine oxidase 2 [Phytophthora citrophthora]|uniref:Plant cysteine oxidase 2 n=1 Tax=Phytophthora citrophthora TaxID=4793 RepID=A0AAD9G3U4_9STRA|nr:Plant cysteine oxidase 2 [Phytophthora citrophthora]
MLLLLRNLSFHVGFKDMTSMQHLPVASRTRRAVGISRDSTPNRVTMDLLNAVWNFSFGGDKDVAEGQKALEQIQDLLVKAITKYEGALHALTREEIAPIKAICDQLFPANCNALCVCLLALQLKVPGTEGSGPERPKRVHYQHVYEDETFSIGIFILPPGASIPLHDHPGMSVISRLLYGSLHVKSYDLVKDSTTSSGKKFTARLLVDEVVTAPHTTELLPDFGNLHELVGGDDIGCAFFDIITPPYDANVGRDCTYFRVVDAKENSEKLVTLESYVPLDFDVATEAYHGPHLQRYVS